MRVNDLVAQCTGTQVRALRNVGKFTSRWFVDGATWSRSIMYQETRVKQ